MNDIEAIGHSHRFAIESAISDLFNERAAHRNTKAQLEGQLAEQHKAIQAISSKPEAADLVKQAVLAPPALWHQVLAADPKLRRALQEVLSQSTKGPRPVPDAVEPGPEATKPKG